MIDLFTAIGIVVIAIAVIAFLTSYYVMCSEVITMGEKLDRVIKELDSKKPKKEAK